MPLDDCGGVFDIVALKIYRFLNLDVHLLRLRLVSALWTLLIVLKWFSAKDRIAVHLCIALWTVHLLLLNRICSVGVSDRANHTRLCPINAHSAGHSFTVTSHLLVRHLRANCPQLKGLRDPDKDRAERQDKGEDKETGQGKEIAAVSH
jgi:hypothetical protein